MTAGPGPQDGSAQPAPGRFRASDADRERVINVLKTAFTEGRLTKDEYDMRLAQVFPARTYADLGAVTGDLPVPAPPPQDAYPQPRYAAGPLERRANSLATAALVLAIAQLAVGGIAGIPAIILGTRARRQIRETGERGYGRATAALILGWIGITMLIAGLAIAGRGHFG